MKILIVAILLLSISKMGWTKEFNDYLITQELNEIVNEIDFEGYEKLEQFSNRLNSQIKDGPNYGGIYYVAFLACGTSCQGNVIINLVNGKIIDQITSCDGMEYKLESSLFISNPKIHESEYQMCPTKYFVVVNDKMVELK